jgi:single-stranded DNA-binding protein
MRGLTHVSILGAVVRAPSHSRNTNGTPFLDLQIAGERAMSDGRTMPWYLGVRLGGRWLEERERYTPGAAVAVVGALEQFDAPEHPRARVTRIVPERLEPVHGYPTAMMLEDRSGGRRMPGGVNRALMLATLTRAPDRRTVARRDLTSLAVAANMTQPGGRTPRTVYATLEAWDDLAFSAGRLERGAAVVAWGVLSDDAWRGDDGAARRTLTLTLDALEPLDAKPPATAARPPADPFADCDILGAAPTR